MLAQMFREKAPLWFGRLASAIKLQTATPNAPFICAICNTNVIYPHMYCIWNYESAALVVAVASLVVAGAALWFAGRSLGLAKMDWRQRKWFELYFNASEFCDALEHFQTQHDSTSLNTNDGKKDFNDLIFLVRKAFHMALVFPRNPVVTNVLLSTAVFKDPVEALSKERLQKISDAVEDLRQKALVDTGVLEQ